MLNIDPIGTVHNQVKAPFPPARQRGWGSVVSELVLAEKYAEALDGLEGYSHIMVIFWFDRAQVPIAMKHHPQNRQELPLVGIFAARSTQRPNPIGVTTVPIIGRGKNILRVKGLDAIDGTPILDLKPYIPAFDRVEKPEAPQWVKLIFEQEGYF